MEDDTRGIRRYDENESQHKGDETPETYPPGDGFVPYPDILFLGTKPTSFVPAFSPLTLKTQGLVVVVETKLIEYWSLAT